MPKAPVKWYQLVHHQRIAQVAREVKVDATGDARMGSQELRVHGCQWGITLSDRDVPLGEGQHGVGGRIGRGEAYIEFRIFRQIHDRRGQRPGVGILQTRRLCVLVSV